MNFVRSILFSFLFLHVCGIISPLSAQKTPKWLQEPPKADKGFIYGIGISDLGLEPADAKMQAKRRARLMAVLSHHPSVITTVISSVANADLSGLDIDPRSSHAVEINVPNFNIVSEELAQTYVSDGVYYTLVKMLINTEESAEPRISVRLFRDDSHGASNVSLTVEGLADSLYLNFDQNADLVEFATEWPKINETIRIEDQDLSLASKTPDWISKEPKTKKPVHAAVDLVTLKGRFSPFLSYLQAYVLTLGELNQKLGPVYLLSEDPYEVNGKTIFATLTRHSEHHLQSVAIQNIQFSRAGAVYQTYLRTVMEKK